MPTSSKRRREHAPPPQVRRDREHQHRVDRRPHERARGQQPDRPPRDMEVDRQHRAQRRPRRDPEHAGLRERVAKQPLQRRARHRQRPARDEADQHARQPDADDHGVAPAQHVDLAGQPARRARPRPRVAEICAGPTSSPTTTAPTAASRTSAKAITTRSRKRARAERPGVGFSLLAVLCGAAGVSDGAPTDDMKKPLAPGERGDGPRPGGLGADLRPRGEKSVGLR